MAEEKNLKVYCETSFWSFLNGRPAPLAHVAVKQAAALQWWQEIAPKCEIYMSQHVSKESMVGANEDAVRRMSSMQDTFSLGVKFVRLPIARRKSVVVQRAAMISAGRVCAPSGAAGAAVA